MQHQITRWSKFFQGLIATRFRQNQIEAIETLTELAIGHLFGLYNPNQLATALGLTKSTIYSHLSRWSLPQWKRLLTVVGCEQAAREVKRIGAMSDATKSRHRITLCVDDTVLGRDGKLLAYCYHWWSNRAKSTLNGQNLLAITLKVGNRVYPLSVRLIGKQGRANTTKPTVFVQMIQKVIDIFAAHGIAITDYPMTFDSWYGSQPLREQLQQLGIGQILVHAKSNYVFTISGKKAKLRVHKSDIFLKNDCWGCDKPVLRCWGESPTFGRTLLFFFADGGQIKCMMVFGQPLRSAEILRIWHQHHGIEQFWRNIKSIVRLKGMRLSGRDGAYASLCVKVLAYLLMRSVSDATGYTFHQIVLSLSGERELLFSILEHFHPPQATLADNSKDRDDL